MIFLFVGAIFYSVHTGGTASRVNKQLPSHPCGTAFPGARGYINDFTHLFNAEQILTLDSMISLHEKETTNQIAVITIDSTMLGKCSVDEYTLAIANEWGVGAKGKNNGVVIGIAPGMRKISIQNGYGIEKLLSNEKTQVLLDSFFIPEFKQGNYYGGTRNGLAAIIKQLE